MGGNQWAIAGTSGWHGLEPCQECDLQNVVWIGVNKTVFYLLGFGGGPHVRRLSAVCSSSGGRCAVTHKRFFTCKKATTQIQRTECVALLLE